MDRVERWRPFGRTPLLTVVLDAEGFGDTPGERARELFRCGADWLQLRDRRVSDATLLELAKVLVAARDAALEDVPERRSRLRVVVNKRVDVALAAGADGVHLGFDAVDFAKARSLLGPDALIGLSCHSAVEVRGPARAETPPDYVHLAPIWDPNSKPAERPPLGLRAVREASANGLPVFAQGGVDETRLAERAARGVGGFAVTGALARGAAPSAILPALRRRLDEVG